MVNNKKVITVTRKNIINYFILIPFLHPRGFDEIYPLYKTFFTIWLFAAIMIIAMKAIWKLSRGRIHIDFKNKWIVAYFVLAIIITAYSRGNLSSGLQTMFASPALCLYFAINLKKDFNRVLNVLANILIINFILNLTVFYPSFADMYHLLFLGHIQVVSQVGLLGIFAACLLYMQKRKRKAMILIALSGITMLTAGADSAILSLIIIVLVAIMYKWKLYNLLCFNSKVYIVLLTGLSILVVFGSITANNFLNIPNIDYTFSGRNAIWANALTLIKDRPVLGYGIDGVLINVYWGGKMNYAHNQVLQNLLDGGWVLCVSFYAMLFVYAEYINRTFKKKYKVLANATLIAFLCVMIFDSTTLYCYMYVFLSILTYLPEIDPISKENYYDMTTGKSELY